MDPRNWNFDIDRYVNHIMPPPPWRYIPYPVARFFGYRTENDKPKGTGNLMPVFYAFIGIFCGISLIEGVSMHIPSFHSHGAPIIVGSFVSSTLKPSICTGDADIVKGAAAVLEFYAIESPLAQPRNALLGQVFSAIIGVATCKLFLLSDDFASLQWLGGAIACAAATAVMALTKTVHPPAGATALLAVTDARIVALGWFLIPVMVLGCSLMITVALLVNNIGRKFPLYWWTPAELPMSAKGKQAVMEEKKGDVEAVSDNTSGEALAGPVEIVIRPGSVSVPGHVELTAEERVLLEGISRRL